MPNKADIWLAVQRLDRLLFTTREVAAVTNSSISSTTQKLSRLEEKGIIKKIMRGLWALVSDKKFSNLMLVPFLETSGQNYISFLSAMHLHGMISQIPQIITVASTAHSKKINTPIGTYLIHQIEPSFFAGFEWSKNNTYLIATPEKALIDCLYIATKRGQKYSSFPEIELPKGFSKQKAREYIKLICDPRIRALVLEKFERLFLNASI